MMRNFLRGNAKPAGPKTGEEGRSLFLAVL